MKSLKRRSMIDGIRVFWVLSLFVVMHARGQETILVTFDGPPDIPPGADYGTRGYKESGMSFEGRFGRVGVDDGSEHRSWFPDDGSIYPYAALGDSLKFSSINGAVFDAVSIDLAEFSTFYQTPLTVRFVGYHPDGSTVTTNFTTDGVIDGTGPLADFETFYFDQEWTNLARVEIPTYGWSLDNLVVSIPKQPGLRLVAWGDQTLAALPAGISNALAVSAGGNPHPQGGAGRPGVLNLALLPNRGVGSWGD